VDKGRRVETVYMQLAVSCLQHRRERWSVHLRTQPKVKVQFLRMDPLEGLSERKGIPIVIRGADMQLVNGRG
jgi:hypothetical protein